MDAGRKAVPTVLQIIPRLDAGGAERTVIDMARAVKRTGGRALVATEGGRMIAELTDAGGEWIAFPAATKSPARIVSNAFKLERLIREENVNLVHARSRAPAWSANIATARTKIPFVTTYHGAYNQSSFLKGLYNSIMARGDAVIANSRYTADLIRVRHRPPENTLHVVPRGIDLNAFDPANVSKERFSKLAQAWGLAHGDRVILLPARLTAWKGHTVLIDAAQMLVANGLDRAVFVLAGDPQGRDDYVRSIEERIAALHLNQAVRIVGHCDDMPSAYLAAEITVVPSVEPEAFGRTAVEAQAMGSAVIVSDIGATAETVLAPPEALPEKCTGWRVPAGDAGALAYAIWEAMHMADQDKRALATRARAHTAAHFSLPVMVAKTLGVYDSLLGTAMRASFEQQAALPI